MKMVVHNKIEPYDVLIDRTTKWGNPYSHKEGTLAKYIVSSAEESVEKYEEYLLSNKELLSSLHELKGKVLGCWCKIKGNEPCHGDILIKYVNNIKEEK